MKPLVTFIITTFNVEDFIEDCVVSIINQKLVPFEYEIIIVDDFSIDNTKVLLNLLKKKYLNINLVFNKKNLGPGISRNIGLKFSRGKYIIFVDGDDFINKSLLFHIQKSFKKKYDLIFYNFNLLKEGVIYGSRKDAQYLKNKKSILKNYIQLKLDTSVIYCAIKRTLIKKKKIIFSKGVYEDIPYLFKLFFFSKNYYYCRKKLYYKNFRKNSIIHSVSQKKFSDYVSSYFQILKFILSKKNINTDEINSFKIGYAGILGSYLEQSFYSNLNKYHKSKLYNFMYNFYVNNNFLNLENYFFLTQKDKITEKFLYLYSKNNINLAYKKFILYLKNNKVVQKSSFTLRI